MSLTASAEAIDAGTLVRATGRLDSATSGPFEKQLLEHFGAPGSRVLVDLAALDYVSSAGLRVILMAAKRAKQTQGRLVLCALQPHVLEVFEISGFLKIIEVEADEAAGRARLAA